MTLRTFSALLALITALGLSLSAQADWDKHRGNYMEKRLYKAGLSAKQMKQAKSLIAAAHDNRKTLHQERMAAASSELLNPKEPGYITAMESRIEKDLAWQRKMRQAKLQLDVQLAELMTDKQALKWAKMSGHHGAPFGKKYGWRRFKSRDFDHHGFDDDDDDYDDDDDDDYYDDDD